MNDSDVGRLSRQGRPEAGAGALARPRQGHHSHSESLALLKYFAQLLRFHPHPIGEFLKADAKADAGKNNDAVNYDEMEPWTRVSPRDYDRNLREMVRLAPRPRRPGGAARQRVVARKPVSTGVAGNRAGRAGAARRQPADHPGGTRANRTEHGDADSSWSRREPPRAVDTAPSSADDGDFSRLRGRLPVAGSCRLSATIRSSAISPEHGGHAR